MAYGITSKSQIIDINAISSGCNELRKAAEEFSSCGKLVSDAGGDCTADVLSVDDQSMEPVLESLGKSIKDVESTIVGYANSIESAANQVYNAQVAELAEYNRRLQEAKEE